MQEREPLGSSSTIVSVSFLATKVSFGLWRGQERKRKLCLAHQSHFTSLKFKVP